MMGRKVIFVRCINGSYNNVAEGIRLLDKKAIFVYTGKVLTLCSIHRIEQNICLVGTKLQLLSF